MKIAFLSTHTWWTTSCTTGGIHEPSYRKIMDILTYKYGKQIRMNGSQVCACHISSCWSARCRYWPFCWCWRSPCSPLRNTLSRTGAKKTPGDLTTSEATVVNYIVWLCVLLSFWSCYLITCKTGTFRLETLNCQVLCIVHTCAEWGELSSWNFFLFRYALLQLNFVWMHHFQHGAL